MAPDQINLATPESIRKFELVLDKLQENYGVEIEFHPDHYPQTVEQMGALTDVALRIAISLDLPETDQTLGEVDVSRHYRVTKVHFDRHLTGGIIGYTWKVDLTVQQYYQDHDDVKLRPEATLSTLLKSAQLTEKNRINVTQLSNEVVMLQQLQTSAEQGLVPKLFAHYAPTNIKEATIIEGVAPSAFILLEWIDGITLSNLTDYRDIRGSMVRYAGVLDEIAQVHGVLATDPKPANAMLTVDVETGEPLIVAIDWGAYFSPGYISAAAAPHPVINAEGSRFNRAVYSGSALRVDGNYIPLAEEWTEDVAYEFAKRGLVHGAFQAVFGTSLFNTLVLYRERRYGKELDESELEELNTLMQLLSLDPTQLAANQAPIEQCAQDLTAAITITLMAVSASGNSQFSFNSEGAANLAEFIVAQLRSTTFIDTLENTMKQLFAMINPYLRQK